jgi:hypothetical protein
MSPIHQSRMNGAKMSRFLALTLAAGTAVVSTAVLAATTKERVRGEVTSIGGGRTIQRNPRKPAYCETGRPISGGSRCNHDGILMLPKAAAMAQRRQGRGI